MQLTNQPSNILPVVRTTLISFIWDRVASKLSSTHRRAEQHGHEWCHQWQHKTSRQGELPTHPSVTNQLANGRILPLNDIVRYLIPQQNENGRSREYCYSTEVSEREKSPEFLLHEERQYIVQSSQKWSNLEVWPQENNVERVQFPLEYAVCHLHDQQKMDNEERLAWGQSAELMSTASLACCRRCPMGPQKASSLNKHKCKSLLEHISYELCT